MIHCLILFHNNSNRDKTTEKGSNIVISRFYAKIDIVKFFEG